MKSLVDYVHDARAALDELRAAETPEQQDAAAGRLADAFFDGLTLVARRFDRGGPC